MAGQSDTGTWFKTGFKGVRYRKHPTRKHGVQPDRYYVITYKLKGKTKTEAVGWASEKVKPLKAFNILCDLKDNHKSGKGPQTYGEMREEEEFKRMEKAKILRAEKKLSISFKRFFDETFFPDAATRWKPDTARKAKEHVTNWIDPVTANTPMQELGLQEVNRIKANLTKAGRSPRLQQYVFRTFSMVWNAALDYQLVKGPSPTKSGSFRLPRVDNERQRYLTLTEEKKLLEAVKKRSQQAHDMAVVALDAGLRFGEIASLTWGSFDVETGTLRILNTKSGKDRFVPMTRRLAGLFDSMEPAKPRDLVFPNTRGNKHTQIPSSFKRGVEDSKLNEDVTDHKMRVSFHTLRHTCASRLVQAGVDLYRVQRLLGHSTPVMTTRYSKLTDGDLRNAVRKMESFKKQSLKGNILNINAK